MQLKIQYDDEMIPVKNIEYNNSLFKLQALNREKVDISVNIKYHLIKDDEYDLNNFELYILNNQKCVENSIFQVYEKTKSKRIGWIFTVQSLVSNEHKEANNKYFLKYAYVAMEILIRRIESIEFNDDIYEIDDFYNSESVILIIDKGNISDIEDFKIENYIPYLYKYGYCFNGNNDLPYFTQVEERLNLHSISPILKEENYIIELFKNFLGNEASYLLKFYLLYQVIELILEKIFDKEFKDIVHGLSSNDKSLFDTKETLSTIANEKYRIKKLFTNYSKNIEALEELKIRCNLLLEKKGKKKYTTGAESLYSVRNLLVHLSRIVNDNDKELINEINMYFEICIIELITIGIKEL